MSQQQTSTWPASRVVMVRPQSFFSNPETKGSNAFQIADTSLAVATVTQKAQHEFDTFQNELCRHGIEINLYSEVPSAHTPDALFPNNWFVHLPDGRVFLMPMQAENRRREYREDIIQSLNPREVIDLRPLAEKNLFLEGTGSLILDHTQKTGFACLSPRTDEEAVRIFSEHSGYRITIFDAVDDAGQAIYHTNVMMALSPDLAVVNLSAVTNGKQRHDFLQALNREVVDIAHTQMQEFAGNMLFLKNSQDEHFWVCSRRAYESLTPGQRKRIEINAGFIFSDLITIETYGGGGARCLLAEVFVP